MKTQIVEVTNGPSNWGKFLIGTFDIEYRRESIVSPGFPLAACIGWSNDEVLVLDLQTREGAVFYPRRSTSAHHDLDKHRIWVCPLFEPFLHWLYVRAKSGLDLDELPGHVDIPEAPFEFRGHRRSGPRRTMVGETSVLPREALRCSRCGKPVSTPIPVATVVRAWVECPECISKGP